MEEINLQRQAICRFLTQHPSPLFVIRLGAEFVWYMLAWVLKLVKSNRLTIVFVDRDLQDFKFCLNLAKNKVTFWCEHARWFI